MKISVLYHSSIRIEFEDKVIYFDPFEIKQESHDATLVFITHDHFDHYSEKDIDKIANRKTIIIYPESCKKTRYKNVLLVSSDKSYESNGISFQTVKSYNNSKNFHRRENGYLGYIVSINNEKFYVMGDCDENEDNLRIKCDYLFIPIGGTYTFDYMDAVDYIKKTNPKYVVPHHLAFCEDKNVLREFEKEAGKYAEVVL